MYPPESKNANFATACKEDTITHCEDTKLERTTVSAIKNDNEIKSDVATVIIENM